MFNLAAPSVTPVEAPIAEKDFSLSLDQALMGFYSFTMGDIMGNMQDHQKDLESKKNTISFLNRIAARLSSLTDETGKLNIEGSPELDELVEWLIEAKETINLDIGDINSFLAAPNPVLTQNLAGNVRTSIDQQKMHAKIGLTKSQTLQQKFSLVVSMINEILKKHGESIIRPAAAINH